MVAEVERQARKDQELFVAESRAIISDLKAKIFELETRIKEVVDSAIMRVDARVDVALARVKDGDPGPSGVPGRPGERGERGEKGDSGERGERGEIGPSGDPGVAGSKGESGRDGLPGLSGRDGKDGFAGKDGERGKDGFSLDDFSVSSPDDGRTVVLSFVRGDEVTKRELRTAHPIYCGIWRAGTYQKGDVVTFGGSAFIAKVDTEAKPETDDWQMFVKRGRDGKDGKQGDKGDKGDPGNNGRDLTQLGPDGSKW